MNKFFRFEKKSDTECTMLLMQPAEGGAYPVWQMDMPLDVARGMQDSLESFLVIFPFLAVTEAERVSRGD